MGETTTPQANCTFGVRRSAFYKMPLPGAMATIHWGSVRTTWRKLKTQLIRHEYGAFRKRSLKLEEFENAGFHLLADENILKTPDGVMLIKWFPWPTSPKTQIQNFSGVVWTQNIWCVFRVKTPFSNFFGVAQTGSDTASPKRQFFLDHVYLAEICYLCIHQAVSPVPITFHLHTMVRPCQPRSSLWLLIVLLDKFGWLDLLWDPTFNQAGS